jgi:hypothetical protein
MNIILTILTVVAGIIVLLLIIAVFIKREHYVMRETIINAPRQKVFDYIKFLKNQDDFNKHAMKDRDRKREFKGTDGTVGYIYAWSGDKSAGEGQKEIISIIEGEKIETEIRFVKPMSASARVIMATESLSENQTRVSWSNAGTLKYPINMFIPMMEKSVARDMDISLNTLKNTIERQL